MLAFQIVQHQQEQVIGKRREVASNGFGRFARGPCLLFRELVFELIKALFYIPAQPKQQGDDARRQGVFRDQKGMDLVGLWILITRIRNRFLRTFGGRGCNAAAR